MVDAKYINRCIESMINGSYDDMLIDNHMNNCMTDDKNGTSGYLGDFTAILGAFKLCCTKSLTKNDIFRQLVLIDSLYSTNIRRMRVYGLEEICDGIYSLCNDGRGKHMLTTLTHKIDVTKPLDPCIENLFKQYYGYVRGEQKWTAPSLISKYLYFATLVCHCDRWGFPIYDKIVCDLLPSMQECLCLPVTNYNGVIGLTVVSYIDALKQIIGVLEADNSSLWSGTPMMKFQLLDYFLWHIGKAGRESYSLLMTKAEVKSCYAEGKLVKLPLRILIWQKMYRSIKR